MKKLAKLFSLLLVFAMAFSLFAACGNSEEATTEENKTETEEKTENKAEEKTEAKDSIIIATANETPTLHPYEHSAVAATYMNYLTYDYFLTSNVDTLEPEVGMIIGWENPSDVEWVFEIRDDVTYHNGEKVLAEDFVASMYYAKDVYGAYTQNYTEFFESAEVIDDTHFKVTTFAPFALTLNKMSSFKVLDKDLIDADHDFNAEPIGTGAYKFVKWELGDHLDFVANEDYWQGAPAIKNMTWRVIPEGSSRTIALEAGEIDVIIEVETNDMARMQETDGLTVATRTGTSFNWLILNNERAPFDNKDFRHFMNCAIQKEALVEVALNGAGTANYRQSPAMFVGATDKNIDKYDPELAQKYLDASGIDPKTVVFSCICSDDVKRRCAEVIQATLAEYGVTMNLESMDLATYLSTAGEGNFDTCIGGCTSSEGLGFVEYKYTSKMIGGSNWTRTNDAYIDEMYDKASQTLDAAERAKMVEEMVAYLQDLCPQVPTYSSDVVRAYNSDLQGYQFNASGNTYWHGVSWAE